MGIKHCYSTRVPIWNKKPVWSWSDGWHILPPRFLTTKGDTGAPTFGQSPLATSESVSSRWLLGSPQVT